MIQNNSAATLRRRKMLLILPAMIFPFITLAFWSLGGGKGNNNVYAIDVIAPAGLNPNLPDTRLKENDATTKLSYYKKADLDSMKRSEREKADSYFKFNKLPEADSTSPATAEKNAEKIYSRIADLDREINSRNNPLNDREIFSTGISRNHLLTGRADSDISRLDELMKTVASNDKKGDPELDQLSSMLDKIMDIQHPERLNEELKANSLKQNKKAFAVSASKGTVPVSLLINESIRHSDIDTIPATAFLSMNQPSSNMPVSIEAVVQETRTIYEGATLKLRLLSDIYVNGEAIGAGNFIYGKTSLRGERLLVDISSIRHLNDILPVSMSVYDLDGLEGISIPGSISRDASKESSGQLIQGLALNSLNPSIGAQAASAGIEAAKNLVNKKVKRIRVTVKSGYRILLK